LAVARGAVLSAAAALAGCADAGVPALDGGWQVQTGRFVIWQIVLGNEGTGVIGRASYYNSSGVVFSAAPVYGPYPQVRYDVAVPSPEPTVPQLASRYVFSGRMRDDCNAERGACIRGSLTVWENGQPTGPAQWLDLFRVDP
jgi:hypothetical protein